MAKLQEMPDVDFPKRTQEGPNISLSSARSLASESRSCPFVHFVDFVDSVKYLQRARPPTSPESLKTLALTASHQNQLLQATNHHAAQFGPHQS